jgi:two-component system, OmpR family, response regulator MprA
MARIMIIDDHTQFRQFLGAHMALAGHTVEEACDGMDALEKIDAFRPEAIVLDSMMPRKDGPTLLRELRRRSGTVATPIVMLTARARLDDKRLAFESGVDDYLVKPLDPQELSMRITRLLQRAA